MSLVNIALPFFIHFSDSTWGRISLKKTLEDVQIDTYLALTTLHKIYLALICLPSTVFYSLGLFTISRLMSEYEKGYYFTIKTVNLLKRSAIFFFVCELLEIVQEIAYSYCLTMKNEPGSRFIKISFTNHNFSQITLSLMIILIAWIMKEALKLKSENELMI
ncbi:MAG: DUF2975 domain-containing protein [Holosporaceae bacterium]|nr:MAG: DUF2975 domain-containing protein [Holosporaceae bacterium]